MIVSVQTNDPNLRQDNTFVENIAKFDLAIHPLFAFKSIVVDSKEPPGVDIIRIHSLEELQELDGATPMMGIWPGKFNTDHWLLQAHELKEQLNAPQRGL